MKKLSCIVPDCDSVDSQHDGANTKFHQFPKEAEVRKKWLKAIKRTEGEVNKRSKVCSRHFKTDDYAITRLNYGVGGKPTASGSKNTCEFKALKSEAVPNMNLPPKSTFKIKISKKDNSKHIKVEEIKVKEEKIEKPERVKMPKRPAPPDSPPRSRTGSRPSRAASKEALKQMQLLLDDENDAVEIPDDYFFDVMPIAPSPPMGPPPKKKHKVSHRKSADATAKPAPTDRDTIVLQTITNRDAENTLELDCWVEQPDQIHKDRRKKYLDEQKELQDKLDALVAENHGKVIFKNETSTIIEVLEQVRSAVEGAEKPPTSVIINNNLGGTQSYNLVMDPTAGLVASAPIQITPPVVTPALVAVTPQKAPQARISVVQDLQQTPPPAPTTPRVATRNRARGSTSKNTPPPPAPVATPPTRSKATPAQSTPPVQAPPTRNQTRAQVQTTPAPKPPPATPQTRGQVQNTPQTRGQNAQTRGQNTPRAAQIPTPTPTQTRAQAAAATPPTPTPTPPQTRGKKQVNTRARGVPGSNTFTTTVRPSETNVEGGLSAGNKNQVVEVDLTSTDDTETSKLPPDSREIAFNKLQGKTYPSLVVVARPHLRAKDLSLDRPKLDAKVKSVLMHAPPKFTEWLIQQGLIRSEQKCTVHTSTQLKLGMYSDVSKFPYSGGYVWISECCPQRFVSVFSGSLFEGSPHPPVVILKLLYHWACQTNIQNVVQWVKVDNLYVKGMFTWLRSICTVGLQSHFRQLGGPGVKVEVGVISLGTSSQDGSTRQVKVEVLGVLEADSKLIRLRAVEPQSDGDRSYKKRFSKILEPLVSWVHPHSMLVADMTVDKQALYNMGFTNVVVSTVVTNNQIMEYLRRIVPRMFQNTLSLLSRQIIQQFLDELVWREWFGTSSLQAFDSVVQHLAEQTRYESGMSLIVRLNKVAQNPFKSWNMGLPNTPKIPVENNAINATNATNNSKKSRNARKPELPKVNQVTPTDVNRPPKSTSPDVPEQMVPLESYYYGTIETYTKTPKITLNMKCPFCKSVFDNNIQLMSHLFKHAHNVSMDAQLCRYCLTSVATANDLLKHIATSHPAETKFDNGFCCLICETPYMNPFILGKHMSKEHSPSELPYQCGTCGYRCSNHKQAIDHFYKAHDNGPTIQCPFCLKSTTVFTSSRNIVQNMNYFIQHLQKHQRKNLARRCGKCNSWFVQKDALNDHQKKMHISQRGKPELVPWTAPRNGIMVPKSKMDKYPVDAEVIDFDALKLDLSKGLMCKECDTPMDTPKHFPSFESCQNPNCQYSTCCTNAMQEHNAKCSKTNNPIAEEKLPFEMFCICGFSNTDGNRMAKHLATCERKSAYPSRADARSATVTHSMLDVLGLVRRAEEIPKPTDTTKSDDSKPKPKTEKRKRAKNEEESTIDGANANKDSVEVLTIDEKEDEVEVNKRKRRRLLIQKKESTGDVITVVDDKDEVNKKDGNDIEKTKTTDKPEIENKDVEQPLAEDKSSDSKSKDETLETEEKLKQDDTPQPMEQNATENVDDTSEPMEQNTTENVDESVTDTPKDGDDVQPSENVEAAASENEQSANLQNHVDDSENTSEEKQEMEEDKENLADSTDDKSQDTEIVDKDTEETNLTKEHELEDKDGTDINKKEEDTSSKSIEQDKGDENDMENQTDDKLHDDERDNEESVDKNVPEDKNGDSLEGESKEEDLLEEERSKEDNVEKSNVENLEEESRENEECQEEDLRENDVSQEEESQDNVQNVDKDDKEEIGDEGESKDNESLDDKDYSEESQEVQNKHEEEAKIDEDELKVQSEKEAETQDEAMEEQEEKQVDDDQELDREDETTEDKVDVAEDDEEEVNEDKEEDVVEEKDAAVAEEKDEAMAEEKDESMAEEKEEDEAEDNKDVNEDIEDVLLEEEDVIDNKEKDTVEDKEEEVAEEHEGVDEDREEINKDEEDDESQEAEDVHKGEDAVTNDEELNEITEKEQDDLESSEKQSEDLNASEKQSEDLDVSEKQSEDMDVSEKQSEDFDVSEKQSEDFDTSEKQSLDFEGPEDPTDLQNHVTNDNTNEAERPTYKQPKFSSDDIHDLLSNVVGETESDSKNPNVDSGGDGSTPMDTD